ncbi:MAG: lipopolysaccharide heptosyltransferase II [Candidatus Scalindua sp.]
MLVNITPSQCLIVGPAWVGDMVMAQSLFIKLKNRYPTMALDVLAPAWSKPLLECMPEVRDAITMSVGHGELQLAARYRLGRSLRQRYYDWAILLPNSLKSALVPFWATIPVRTGYRGEMRYGLLNDVRVLDKRVLSMTVQRFVALGLPKTATIPPAFTYPHITVSTDIMTAVTDKFNLKRESPVLALCPGAEYGPAKQWPYRHYAALANVKLREGWQVWVLGSEKDRVVATQICDLADNMVNNMAGKTSLQEAIALLASANAVVTNDSGLMHISAALGTPLVAVYGSSDPGFTPPLSNHATVVRLGLDCSPCFQRQCPLGHMCCLRDISPSHVIEAIDQIVQ